MTNAYSIDVLLPSIIVIIVAQTNHFVKGEVDSDEAESEEVDSEVSSHSNPFSILVPSHMLTFYLQCERAQLVLSDKLTYLDLLFEPPPSLGIDENRSDWDDEDCADVSSGLNSEDEFETFLDDLGTLIPRVISEYKTTKETLVNLNSFEY